MKYLIGAGVIACSALAGGPALAGGSVTKWLCSTNHEVAGMVVLALDSYAFLGAGADVATPVEYERDGKVDLRGALNQRVVPGGAVMALSSGPLVTKYGLTSGYLNANSTKPSLVFGDVAAGSLQCQPD